MAATAAVASSFSSSMQSIYYCNIRSSKKINWPSHVDPLLKIASISHSLIGNESISIAAPKWRFPRLAAAVAQEEAALIEETTNTTTVEAEEEDQRNAEEKEEVSSHTENSSSSSANTKLYFGNLPYHVDSAQLAGIIQDFGSPELVEVYIIFTSTLLITTSVSNFLFILFFRFKIFITFINKIFAFNNIL